MVVMMQTEAGVGCGIIVWLALCRLYSVVVVVSVDLTALQSVPRRVCWF